MADSTETRAWPPGLWDRAKRRDYGDLDSYLQSTPLEDALLDIETSLDEAIVDGDVDSERLRRLLGLSAYHACSAHGMEQQRHLQSFDIDPFQMLIAWALGYGMNEAAAILRRMMTKARRESRDDDPPQIF